MTDFMHVFRTLRSQMWEEIGPYHKRKSCILYRQWVEQAGGRVRGLARKKRKNKEGLTTYESALDLANDDTPTAWQLQLVDLRLDLAPVLATYNLERSDPEHVDLLYGLLGKHPAVIHHYLSDFVFPETMRHQSLKISASGQALGGSLLFERRCGATAHLRFLT